MIVCARFLLCIAFLLSTVCHFSFARRPDRTDDSASEKSVVFNAEDITHLTLYGPNAVYLSDSCPKKFKFTNRARQLPELAEDKVGIFPEDIVVNGKKCSSDATMLVFQPIGKPSHFPPQWVFEDSRITGRPVNFTCGRNKFSIRFGYFNDVSTKHSDGFLDPNVVYFDFAVIPYRKPFAFCSYTTRRTDGRKPLKYAPFPSQDVWDHVSSLEERSSETDEGLVDKSLDSTPENEEPSMEPPAHPTPDLVPTIAPDVARQRLVPDPFSS